MPFQDSTLRDKIDGHGKRAAEAVQTNEPATAAERRQRQNAKTEDISNTTLLGMNLLETLTT